MPSLKLSRPYTSKDPEEKTMATVNQKNQQTTKKPVDQTNSKKPKVRDTTDSRKNEEQDFKGDNETHNKKATEREK